jgi:hypothetical protein
MFEGLQQRAGFSGGLGRHLNPARASAQWDRAKSNYAVKAGDASGIVAAHNEVDSGVLQGGLCQRQSKGIADLQNVDKLYPGRSRWKLHDQWHAAIRALNETIPVGGQALRAIDDAPPAEQSRRITHRIHRTERFKCRALR